MTKSNKHKNERKKDFQKEKLKVGKARPKNTNATDTSFAARCMYTFSVQTKEYLTDRLQQSFSNSKVSQKPVVKPVRFSTTTCLSSTAKTMISEKMLSLFSRIQSPRRQRHGRSLPQLSLPKLSLSSSMARPQSERNCSSCSKHFHPVNSALSTAHSSTPAPA